MGVSVVWDNEQKTILCYTMQGRWNWGEFQAEFEKARAMLAAVQHEVNFILDVRNSSFVPTGALLRIRNVYTNAPSNAGITVVVGASPIMKSLQAMLVRLYPAIAEKYIHADTLDAARSLLANRAAISQPDGQSSNQTFESR